MGFSNGISLPHDLDPPLGSMAYYEQQASERERNEFIVTRSAEILADKDAQGDLIAYMMENKSGHEIMWALRHATAANWIGVHARFELELKVVADWMAAREWDRR